MKNQTIISIAIGITLLFGIASVPLFAGSASAAESASAEPTLWGIYGAHNRHDCPVNNRKTAKEVIAISLKDLGPLMKKYGVTAIVDQYHSGLISWRSFPLSSALPAGTI